MFLRTDAGAETGEPAGRRSRRHRTEDAGGSFAHWRYAATNNGYKTFRPVSRVTCRVARRAFKNPPPPRLIANAADKAIMHRSWSPLPLRQEHPADGGSSALCAPLV
jgi:hypothetical protein